jgi:addiction module HigA family antidote
MEGLGLSQAALAERTGRPTKTINEIIRGKARITPDTALQLERVLGVSAGFWNNRERLYRETLARLKERETLKDQVHWLKELPVRAMVKLGWIKGSEDRVDQVNEILRFFGVASREQWWTIWDCERAYFRKSEAFESDPGSLSAWLRRGEIEGQAISCERFNASKLRKALRVIRRLTLEAPEVFQPELIRLCAACGVAVVFVPELPRTRASGAMRWISPRKALIQLSLRYKSDDHLWFTFFHESGHTLQHKKRVIFLERHVGRNTTEEEREANKFAEDMLIPSPEFQRFVDRGAFTKKEIVEFAHQIEIAPGIVVGRLQHAGILPHSHCNDLKRSFVWA